MDYRALRDLDLIAGMRSNRNPWLPADPSIKAGPGGKASLSFNPTRSRMSVDRFEGRRAQVESRVDRRGETRSCSLQHRRPGVALQLQRAASAGGKPEPRLPGRRQKAGLDAAGELTGMPLGEAEVPRTTIEGNMVKIGIITVNNLLLRPEPLSSGLNTRRTGSCRDADSPGWGVSPSQKPFSSLPHRRRRVQAAGG